jgi:hypothetical protein
MTVSTIETCDPGVEQIGQQLVSGHQYQCASLAACSAGRSFVSGGPKSLHPHLSEYEPGPVTPVSVKKELIRATSNPIADRERPSLPGLMARRTVIRLTLAMFFSLAHLQRRGSWFCSGRSVPPA